MRRCVERAKEGCGRTQETERWGKGKSRMQGEKAGVCSGIVKDVGSVNGQKRTDTRGSGKEGSRRNTVEVSVK